jgi:drug/metabolite transporter (DMT)-like permease
MDLRIIMLLAVTAVCWGSSFAFIKVGVDELHPMLVMAIRCGIGGAMLWTLVAVRRARNAHRHGVLARGRAHVKQFVANGLMTGVPLTLVGVGERHIDSGLAGIVNASVPLWAALLAMRWDSQHRTTRRRLVGVAIGFAGVVVLMATRGAIGGAGEVTGLLAVASGSAVYAISGVYVRERLSGIPPVELAAWSVTWAAVLFAVPGILAEPLPDSLSTSVVGSLVLLGALGTCCGFLAYYELLDRAGATRATMVTYLLPPLALVYGAVLLGERMHAESLLAMLVILAGVWIGSRGGASVDPVLGQPGT